MEARQTKRQRLNEIAASVVSLYAEEPVTSPYHGLFHDMVEMMIEVNAEVEAIEADEAAAAEGDSLCVTPHALGRSGGGRR